MFSPEVHHLILQEQRKDHLAAMENQRLIQGTKLQPSVIVESYCILIHWLGRQLMIWGSKLQSYGTTPIAANTVSQIR